MHAHWDGRIRDALSHLNILHMILHEFPSSCLFSRVVLTFRMEQPTTPHDTVCFEDVGLQARKRIS